MLNVLYVSHLTDLSRGGQRSLLTLVEHLDHKHVKPFLLVPRDGELAESFRKLGAEVILLDFPSLGLKRLASIVRTVRQIRGVLKQHSIHIVHSDNERATLYCGLAASALATKVFWHIRVAGGHHLDRAVVKFSDRLIGISDGVFSRFTFKHDPQKYRKVYNGVDLRVFRPSNDQQALRRELGLPTDRRIVAFAGQINERKGVLDLLQAWVKLSSGGSQACPLLLIIGRRQSGGAWEPELDRLLNLPELANNVREYPQQSNINDWFAAVDAVILPSHQGVEGMGRVLFEAMACGAVAMGSDTLGVNEVITDDSGILFPERSPEAIAASISALFADSDRVQFLRNGGLERARTVFDVNIHAKNIQQVYDEFWRD